MAKTLNSTIEITLNQLIPNLKRCILARIPAFVSAGPGIGKSASIAALAKSLGGESIDIRLSQLQPTDLIGIPMPDVDKNGNKKMIFAPMGMLPTAEFCADKPVVILFLDELNSAPPSVQSAAYQLVNDRKVGTYFLPDNVAIVAAGNREGDRGVTFRMAKPLANRFMHFNVRHDYDSWLDWATNSNINVDVVAFVSNFKEKLYVFDPASPDMAFATPRSWEFLSRILNTNTPENPIAEEEYFPLVAASVGSGIASEFIEFRRTGKNLPKPAEILSGRIKKINTQEISAHYQITVSMLYELNEFLLSNSSPTGVIHVRKSGPVDKRKFKTEELAQQFRNQLDNFFHFIIGNFQLEVGIMAARMASGPYAFIFHSDMNKLKSFGAVCTAYSTYLTD